MEEYSFDFATAFVVGCFSKEEEEEKGEIESMSFSPSSSSSRLFGVDPPTRSILSMVGIVDETDSVGHTNSNTPTKQTKNDAATPPRLLSLRAPLVDVVVSITVVRVLVLKLLKNIIFFNTCFWSLVVNLDVRKSGS